LDGIGADWSVQAKQAWFGTVWPGKARAGLAGLELRVVAGSGRQGIDSSGAVRSGNDRQERTGAEWRVGDRSDAEWRGRQGLESF
jgi:hypothetical protein